MDKANAEFSRDIVSARLGSDDGDLLGIDLEMAQQQGQNTLADAAKTDDHKAAGKGNMLSIEHNGQTLLEGTVVLKSRSLEGITTACHLG